MKTNKNLIKLGVLACALLVMPMACTNTSNDTDTAEVEAVVEEPALNDAQIASIAVTANQIDIEYAEIAAEKATNDAVKEFAHAMATDHQSVIDQAVALATELGVTPEDNPTTQSLLDGAKAVKDKFAGLTGADFEKAYIDNEVEYHKAAIGVVENTLIPNCTNEQLKSLLETALPLFKTHLEHAEMVQSGLNK